MSSLQRRDLVGCRLRNTPHGQAHLLVILFDPQDPRTHPLTDRVLILQRTRTALDLADMGQTFEAIEDVDEQTEVRDVDHSARNGVADLTLFDKAVPLVG